MSNLNIRPIRRDELPAFAALHAQTGRALTPELLEWEYFDRDLAREGIIELIGPTLRSSDRVRLQVMFNKVFARNKPLSLLGEPMAQDPRLAGLAVTQFVAEEGWLALAVGGDRAVNMARGGRGGASRR